MTTVLLLQLIHRRLGSAVHSLIIFLKSTTIDQYRSWSMASKHNMWWRLSRTKCMHPASQWRRLSQ